MYQADQVTATTQFLKLVQSKQLGQESFEFMHMWLRYVLLDNFKACFDDVFIVNQDQITSIRFSDIMAT